jgi:hypothetical protein
MASAIVQAGWPICAALRLEPGGRGSLNPHHYSATAVSPAAMAIARDNDGA